MIGTQLSRRRLLQVCGSGVVTATAGCTQRLGSGQDEQTPTMASELESIRFDGPELVVGLSDSSAVSKLVLLTPSGTRFATASVAPGQTTVRFRLLDIQSGSHYMPGEHTLVTVTEDDSTETPVDLAPALEITAVEPYSGNRPTPNALGNVAVTVRNDGTAPTWVYDIAYQEAPYEQANTLKSMPATPTVNLLQPESAAQTLLAPSKERTYVGTTPPFLLDRSADCDGRSIEVTVIAQSAVGISPRQRIRAVVTGELVSANFRSACSELTVQSVRGGTTDA